MAITFTSLAAVTANTNNNQANHTGNTGTPNNGDLLICFISVTGDNQGGGLMSGTFTWNLLESTAHHSTDSLYVFWAAVTSATSVTPVFTITAAVSTGSSMYCVRIAGAEGQNQPYVRQQAVTNSGSTANPSVTMGKAILTGNGCIGVATNATNSPTQWTAPSGWTEMGEVAYNNPTTGFEVASRASGETGTTITWTNSNTTSWRVWIWEFYVAGTGPTECDPSCGILTT